MLLTTVAPYGPAGASARVRVDEWLARLGVPTERHDYIGESSSRPSVLGRRPFAVAAAERDLRRLARQPMSTLLLHREASPLSRGGVECSLLAAASLGVYDFDDALQWDHGTDSAARGMFPKAAKCLAAVRAADRVIAGNALLADWAGQHNRDVVVIPSCVEPRDYTVKTSYELHDPPRLVWLGSPSMEQQLTRVARPLLDVHTQTGARLTVVSAGSAALGAVDAMVDRVQWRPDAVADVLANADVAIAPLVDTLIARGKCGYKLLQYAAAGLPIVGSPVGASADVLAAAGGVAVTATDEWRDALLALLGDSAAQRSQLGQRALRAAEAYSYARWLPVMAAAVGVEMTHGVGRDAPQAARRAG